MKKTPMRLAHILPRKDLFDGAALIPLSNPEFYKKTVTSLREWVATRKPSVLVEHERDGEASGAVVGIVEDERGIFAQLELTPDAESKLKEGKLRFVSGTFAWNHKADDYSDNGAWPSSLLELSMVSVPRHSRQIPMTELNQLSKLSERNVLSSGHVTQLSATFTPTQSFFINEVTDMDLEQLRELLGTMLEEAMTPLLERVDAIESGMQEEPAKEEEAEVEEAGADVKKVEEGEDKSETDVDEGEAKGDLERAEEKEEGEEELAEEKVEEEEESKLSETVDPTRELEKRAVLAEARIAELEGQIALRDAKVSVASDIASRPHMSSMSEKLVKIYMNDKELYKEVLGVVPEANSSILSERVTVGYAHLESKVSDPYKAAAKLAKDEGITYLEALAKVGS